MLQLSEEHTATDTDKLVQSHQNQSNTRLGSRVQSPSTRGYHRHETKRLFVRAPVTTTTGKSGIAIQSRKPWTKKCPQENEWTTRATPTHPHPSTSATTKRIQLVHERKTNAAPTKPEKYPTNTKNKYRQPTYRTNRSTKQTTTTDAHYSWLQVRQTDFRAMLQQRGQRNWQEQLTRY